MNKTHNGTYHEEGWEIFVRENGFKKYDFIAFRLDGGMLFRVKVFKGNECPRKECFALAPSPLTARERNGPREECSTPFSSACTKKREVEGHVKIRRLEREALIITVRMIG